LSSPPPPRSALLPYTTLFRSWQSLRPAYRPGLPHLRQWGRRKPEARRGRRRRARSAGARRSFPSSFQTFPVVVVVFAGIRTSRRSEEHTSELESRENLVCRLL